MLRALEVLNLKFWKAGQPEIEIGVGVNTGTMSVGNMGSRFRRAYTVLGDSVNLASRLEGLTKAYGVDFIVSSFTVDEAPDFVYREVDRVRVKGKLLPVVIYEVLDEQGRVPDEELARLKQWEQFLKLYRAQHWDQASKVLSSLREADPERKLYDMYEVRIAQFILEPPGHDWDGVFTHESK
jgi:adenylate cyclase